MEIDEEAGAHGSWLQIQWSARHRIGARQRKV